MSYINTQDYGTLITELKIGSIQLKGRPPLKQSLEIEPIRTMRLQYGYALQRLASKAFPTISLNAQEQWVLDQFVNGLGNSEIRKHVQFAHPRNLHEAIYLATEYECFEMSSSRRNTKSLNGRVWVDDNKAEEVLKYILSNLKRSND